MKKIFGLTVAALAMISASFLPHLLRACNPDAFVPYPVFINTLHPDLPIGPYTDGNLGVIQPTYGSVYLYVAYRALVGPPIQPSEQEALWHGDERLLKGTGSMSPSEALQHQQELEAKLHPDWEQAWLSVTGGSKPLTNFFAANTFGYVPSAGIYREVELHESNTGFYSQYLNCPQDAFREALNTLKLRTQQFGESSLVVQNWIEAQKQVFGNCATSGTIPASLSLSEPAVARADRAYQIAAAHFYAGDYDEAAAAFRAIAQDRSSPWSTIAPYLVARALVRKATVTENWGPDFAGLAPAEAQINSVLADSRLKQYHQAAERLRGFVEFRLHPDSRLVELANNLMKGPGDANLAQDVTDFRLLLSRAEEGFSNGPSAVGEQVRNGFPDLRAKNDLLDWILTLRSPLPGPYSDSFDKWEVTHSSAWLVGALTKAEPNSPHLPELLEAAGHVPSRSPAYDSVTFHSLRLMVLQGRSAAARERLAHLRIDRMGTLPPNYATPPSTLNLFRALRLALAQNLNELIENSLRVPATITTGDSVQQLPETALPAYILFGKTGAFDDDSLVVLNRFLPVSMLAKAADNPKLPDKLRGEIALAAWTRATLLGKASVARSLAPDVESYIPELKANVQAYNSAATPEEQRFAAALAALRFPGLRPFITTDERATEIDKIDGMRENWWDQGGPPCAMAVFRGSLQPPKPSDLLKAWPKVGRALQAIYPGGQVKPPEFLTAREREEADQESRNLVDLGPAPNYLSKEAVAWAKSHPGDPRVPEALALAVKSTRYGCTDQQTGGFSKAAFELLHRRYPKSSWAENTPYWFK